MNDHHGTRVVALGSAAATTDPVLAQHPERFAYADGQALRYLRYVAALVGLGAVIAGLTQLSNESVSRPVVIGLIAVGVVFIIPTLLGTRKTGRAQWRLRHAAGQDVRLRSRVFLVCGDERRAAEIRSLLVSEPDARRWPVFNPNRTAGAIRVGVHTGPHNEPLMITMWMPEKDQARVWPLIEPRAEHTGPWLQSLLRYLPEPDSTQALGTQLPNMLD